MPFPPATAPASPCPRVGLAASFSSPPLPQAGLSLGEESGGHSPSGPDRGEGAGNVPPLREKGLRERAEGLSPNYFIKLCCMHLFGSLCRKDTCAFNGCSHRHNYRQWKETEKREHGGDVSDNIPWWGLREAPATSLPQVSADGDEQAKRSLLLTGRELGDQEVLLHISCCELFRWTLSAWHCSHKKC